MSTYSLSGSGLQALSNRVTALHVVITTLPAGLPVGRANPANHFDVGLLRPGNGTAYFTPIAIVGGPQWVAIPVGATNLGYSLLNGAVVSVTEIIGGTSPAPIKTDIAAIRLMPDNISVASQQCIGIEATTVGSAYSASVGYIANNMCLMVPLLITEDFTVVSAFMHVGATAAGHWDVGIYDPAFTLLAHTGSVLEAGATLLQSSALAIALSPGHYWLAFSADSTTLTAGHINYGTAAKGRAIGVRAASPNFPLASNPTLVTVPGGTIPEYGISRYTP